jgi:hypothetical protein
MTYDELTKKIAALNGVEPLGDKRTYVHKVPSSENATRFFVRPLADDLVLASSVMRAQDEAALAFGQRILDEAEPHAAKARRAVVTKVSGVAWGETRFDSLLLLGPAVAKFRLTHEEHFLPSRTVLACAIHHIEFSGDETEAEAVVRRKQSLLADITREIVPVIFLRYHEQTGQHSAKYLAIATHDYTTRLINELPRDGGTVELENYERESMGFATDQGNETVDVTFGGKTKKLPLADALKRMDTLTYKGVAEAEKDW